MALDRLLASSRLWQGDQRNDKYGHKTRHRSNENKISDGYQERAPNRDRSVLIMRERDYAAGSRSLH